MEGNMRIAIEVGSTLKLLSGTSNDTYDEYRIESDRDPGATCLVYGAIDLKTNEKVILKEFFPDNGFDLTDLIRHPDTNILILNNADKAKDFADGKEHFIKGIEEYKKWWFLNKQTMPFPYFAGKVDSNETVYVISRLANGSILSYDSIKGNANSCKSWLDRILKAMISICESIEKFHAKDFLYLDLKPDNLFLFDYQDIEDIEIGFFDFDSVSPKTEIQTGKTYHYSSSWAPYELIYSSFRDIDFHTDSYAIGAIFFNLLTNKTLEKFADEQRAPNIKGILSEIYKLKESEFFIHIPSRVFTIIERILKKTIKFYGPNSRLKTSEIKTNLLECYYYLYANVNFYEVNYLSPYEHRLARAFATLGGIKLDKSLFSDCVFNDEDFSARLNMGLIEKSNSQYYMRKLIADHLQSFFYATTFEYENYNVISSIANVLFTINISPLLDKHNRPPIDFADDLFIANYYYLIGNRLINFLLGYWKEVIRSGLPIDESYMVDATYLLNCFRLFAQLCCCLEKYYDVKDFYIMLDEIIYYLPHSPVFVKLMKVYFVLAIDNIDDIAKDEKKQLKKTVLAKKESFKGEAW